MENRIYYGQYSLEHWIELLLKKNLLLPKYQRYFVWNENSVKTLIETFKNKQFVPPITVGAFKIDQSTSVNYILDGQQRLTSLLLAYLSLYPDRNVYKATLEELRLGRLADENDNREDDEEDTFDLDNVLKWNLNELTGKGRNKAEILTNIVAGNYKIVDYHITPAFFKENFLGFSFLVPNITDKKAQQRYYSSVFRNINAHGQALQAQESRASLYFLNEELVEFFNPEISRTITVKYVNSESNADFVRFLSLLSQYEKDGSDNKLARGFKQKIEDYYEEFIYSVVGDRNSQIFERFDNIFQDRDYKPKFEKLVETFGQLDFKKQFSSIIDMDLYFFGLIFLVVFKDRSIDISKKMELTSAIESAIESFKNDPDHRKAPGALKYLRQRVSSSIQIFNQFINE